MMRTVLNYLDVHSGDTVMVGDCTEMDVLTGVESRVGIILVQAGVTRREDVVRCPCQPTGIVASVAEIDP